MEAVAGRSPARWTGAETGGGYVQTVPARAGDLRRLLQEGGPVPQSFCQHRPPVSSPSPFLFLPSPHRQIPRSLPLCPRASLSGVTLPRGATGRFAVAGESPHPRPCCSLPCPASATLPRFPRCSRWEVFLAAPSHFPAVSAVFHSSIYSCSPALIPSAHMPTSSERAQAL